jgi:hypothetical protein
MNEGKPPADPPQNHIFQNRDRQRLVFTGNETIQLPKLEDH